MRNIFLLFILVFGNIQAEEKERVPPAQTSLNTLVEANTLFVFDLYHELQTTRGNLVFSPFSIYTTFGMAASGAKGETAKEMQTTLHYATSLAPLVGDISKILTAGESTKNAPIVSLANAIWVQEELPLLPPFQQTITRSYNATIQQLNFEIEPTAALRQINQWVSRGTQGRINQLVSAQEITNQTRLVLTSAIFMKGQWLHPFDRRVTKRGPFYTTEQHALKVDMMEVSARFPILIDQNFAMIEIPYLNSSQKGPQLSMFILLPNEVQGLASIGKQLNYDNWQKWQKKLKEKRVNLTMPKFRVDQRLDLKQTMSELGMLLAFSPQADFSGITGQKGLYINAAVHKTFMRVDEYGTEAAAATGIGMNLTSVEEPEEIVNFIVDRPFLFLVVDKTTQTILFIGHMIQP